ncbi:acyl-CoA/acyl-ACP dehydrogenase [Candidatus Sumerlaeota bacterium]|nr:acyl-CoA/acyl-ACP dehydrogenase [Candidatus Sumerlaeota bacterium]
MELLKTLPNDAVRQIMWKYSERFDIQMLVQNTRNVARGPVARLVANGGRSSHEWTKEKDELLKMFDEAGITVAALDPENGGFIEGPKNLAFALMAAELAWVDGGAATCSLATNLGFAPIHEKGTPEQATHYQKQLVPSAEKGTRRAAFVLTEPLPFVGVDTGVLAGRIRIAEWNEGEEPILEVDKRGRFITNMAFATIVTAAVQSDDSRIKGSCMVILEKDDEGLFDNGAPCKKLVHQLSSTRDPNFKLRVPASRIIGGYTIQEIDGQKTIVPNFDHGNIIESVFKRTRVTVGVMTPVKLLSAVEPIIRYQRTRFRGGDAAEGTVRYDLGLQSKEDALHRLADVWAMGEAGMSLAMAAAKAYDDFDPTEKEKIAIFKEKGIGGGRAELKALRPYIKRAEEVLRLDSEQRKQALDNEPLTRYVLQEAYANVLCPACKLMCGIQTNAMREAVALMGGYGLTEDCPGFLFYKWTDAQLESTYEGPECVQRRHLSLTMSNKAFLIQMPHWIKALEDMTDGGIGAKLAAYAFKLWLFTMNAISDKRDKDNKPLYTGTRHGVTFTMTDILTWALGAGCFVRDVATLRREAPNNPELANEGLQGLLDFYTDLTAVASTRAIGEVSRLCAEILYGYALDSQTMADFAQLRTEAESAMSGARFVKERVAESLSKVMIPEALDYPM